jgi:cell pole-organizing protein PopZ
MRRYLVVANQTVAGQHLQDKVAQCLAEGPCQFHLVVPATRPNHSLVWTEGQSIALARRRMQEAIQQLRAIGAEVDGEVGDQSPLTAVTDALRRQPFDEIILSTLPPGLSRWLAQDLPRRVRRLSNLPVTHIAARVDASAPAPS